MITVPKIFWNMLKIADIVLIIAVVAFGIGALWLLTRPAYG